MVSQFVDGVITVEDLENSKWGKIVKCSSVAALRDIQDLMTKGIIKKAKNAGGRSINYEFV